MNPHTVTVTTVLDDEGTEDECRRVDTVTFICTAGPDDDCRRYPDCGCETWKWDESGQHDHDGHPRLPGQKCWLAGWFDADATEYGGRDYDDARDDGIPPVDRTGPIEARWVDNWPEWVWEEDHG